MTLESAAPRLATDYFTQEEMVSGNVLFYAASANEEASQRPKGHILNMISKEYSEIVNCGNGNENGR